MHHLPRREGIHRPRHEPDADAPRAPRHLLQHRDPARARRLHRRRPRNGRLHHLPLRPPHGGHSGAERHLQVKLLHRSGLVGTFTHHNIFGGAEKLSVSLNASYEWQTGKNRSSVFNSYEFGIQSSLAFPRLLAPKFIPRSRRDLNWTTITLGGSVLNRPNISSLPNTTWASPTSGAPRGMQ